MYFIEDEFKLMTIEHNIKQNTTYNRSTKLSFIQWLLRERFSPGLKFLRNASWGEEGLEPGPDCLGSYRRMGAQRCNYGEGIMVRYTDSMEQRVRIDEIIEYAG